MTYILVSIVIYIVLGAVIAVLALILASKANAIAAAEARKYNTATEKTIRELDDISKTTEAYIEKLKSCKSDNERITLLNSVMSNNDNND